MISSWKTVASRIRAAVTYEAPMGYCFLGIYLLTMLFDPMNATTWVVDCSSS